MKSLSFLWVVLGLTLVACGGSDDDPAGGGGSNSGDDENGDDSDSSDDSDDSSEDGGTNDSGGNPIEDPGTPSSGCGEAVSETGEELARTMEINGTERDYEIDIPSTYDPDQAYPLIVEFHGINGNQNNTVREAGHLEEAVFIRPMALASNPSFPQQRDWQYNSQVEADNLTYFDELVDKYKSELCIDEDYIFVSGFSAGGSFTTYVGCKRGDMLRAMAPIAGYSYSNVNAPSADCQLPIPAWMAIGQQDTQILNGFDDMCTSMLTANGCASATCSSSGSSSDASTCVEFDCPAESPVTWCVVTGLGHARPDPNWYSAEIWDFFFSLP